MGWRPWGLASPQVLSWLLPRLPAAVDTAPWGSSSSNGGSPLGCLVWEPCSLHRAASVGDSWLSFVILNLGLLAGLGLVSCGRAAGLPEGPVFPRLSPNLFPSWPREGQQLRWACTGPSANLAGGRHGSLCARGSDI